jgi:hypothetical protein
MTTVHMTARPTHRVLYTAFGGSADIETRLLNWYRRERAIVDSTSENVLPHWRRTSQDTCNEIVKALGYTPEIDSTAHRAPENTDAAAHSLGTGESR